MHALNRRDHTLPAIVGNSLRPPAGDEPAIPAMMPCILLALPNPARPIMAVAPDGGKLTADRHPQNAPAQDQPDIWLRNAAAGLCLLAAAAAVVSFTAQYRLVYGTRRLAVVAGLAAVAAAFPAVALRDALHLCHGVLDGGPDLAEDRIEFTLPVQEFRSAESLEWHDPDARRPSLSRGRRQYCLRPWISGGVP